MGDDVVARPFEVVIDTLIEPVVRRLAQVTRFEKIDERCGSVKRRILVAVKTDQRVSVTLARCRGASGSTPRARANASTIG
jgi:hypothetical protein